MDSFPANRGLTSPPHPAAAVARGSLAQASPPCTFQRGEAPGWEEPQLRPSVPHRLLLGMQLAGPQQKPAAYMHPGRQDPRPAFPPVQSEALREEISWEPPWVFSTGKSRWRVCSLVKVPRTMLPSWGNCSGQTQVRPQGFPEQI